MNAFCGFVGRAGITQVEMSEICSIDFVSSEFIPLRDRFTPTSTLE